MSSMARQFGQKPRSAKVYEYYIRRTGQFTFEISKFAEGSTDKPLEVYGFEVNPRTKCPCDCTAWRLGKTRPCKHLGMVNEFVQAGEPVPFVLRR